MRLMFLRLVRYEDFLWQIASWRYPHPRPLNGPLFHSHRVLLFFSSDILHISFQYGRKPSIAWSHLFAQLYHKSHQRKSPFFTKCNKKRPCRVARPLSERPQSRIKSMVALGCKLVASAFWVANWLQRFPNSEFFIRDSEQSFQIPNASQSRINTG